MLYLCWLEFIPGLRGVKASAVTCHLSEPLGWLDFGGFCSVWLLTQVELRMAPPGTWREQGCGGAPEALNLSVSFPGSSEVKASAWNVGDPGSIPGSRRALGEGNGNLLQYSCSSHGGRSLVGYSPWGRKESDMTE